LRTDTTTRLASVGNHFCPPRSIVTWYSSVSVHRSWIHIISRPSRLLKMPVRRSSLVSRWLVVNYLVSFRRICYGNLFCHQSRDIHTLVRFRSTVRPRPRSVCRLLVAVPLRLHPDLSQYCCGKNRSDIDTALAGYRATGLEPHIVLRQRRKLPTPIHHLATATAPR